MFSCEFCEISKSTFSHRTPPVAASEISIFWLSKITKWLAITKMLLHGLVITSTIFIYFNTMPSVSFSYISIVMTGQPIFRSSHRRCFVWKGVLGYLVKLTGKHMCQSLFFNKVAGLRFSCESCKNFKKTFFTEHLRTAASVSCICLTCVYFEFDFRWTRQTYFLCLRP